jgi:hypothetical protein
MWLSVRNISFHVPQAKEQILLYKFPAQASLMVDPASPRAPNDRYSYLIVDEVHGCCLFLDLETCSVF